VKVTRNTNGTLASIEVDNRVIECATDAENDLALMLNQLLEPTARSTKAMRRLIAQIRAQPREPEPTKVMQAVARVISEGCASHLLTRREKFVHFDEKTSPIHQQVKSLARRKKKFSIVIADPPWEYKDKAAAGERGAEFKYPVMKLRDIKNLDVNSIVEDNAVLLLWGTWPLLDEAKAVLRAWGFKYKTNGFVWVKRNKLQTDTDFMGGGHYTRSNSEFVLIGVRGDRIPRFNNNVKQVIYEALRDHSQKPEEFYKSVNRLYDLRKYKTVELFARQRRPNITVLGNDVDRF
jgi:N6-adenosine-specific RNA methylase IME4